MRLMWNRLSDNSSVLVYDPFELAELLYFDWRDKPWRCMVYVINGQKRTSWHAAKRAALKQVRQIVNELANAVTPTPESEAGE
jgi:hypothetical protein